MPNELEEAGISWLIIGAQTRPTVFPKIEWVKEIVMASDQAGIPVFLKDNLKPLLINDKGHAHASVELLDRVIETGTWKLRQEMPQGRLTITLVAPRGTVKEEEGFDVDV